LNQVTQQNAAASEEMASSAEELNVHALQLKEVIAFFKTGKTQDLPAPIKKESIPIVKNDKKKEKETPKNEIKIPSEINVMEYESF
jgi:methyl-accepting chemotaxis protein